MIYLYLAIILNILLIIYGGRELLLIHKSINTIEKRNHRVHLKKHLNFLLPLLVGMVYLNMVLYTKGFYIIEQLFTIDGFVSSGIFFGYVIICYGLYNSVKHLEEERNKFLCEAKGNSSDDCCLTKG